MVAADTIVFGGSLLALCYAAAAGQGLFRRLFDRPGHSCTDAAPYGVGPCGVARVTYPSLHGLVVRELPR